jgi:hypothetical protein
MCTTISPAVTFFVFVTAGTLRMVWWGGRSILQTNPGAFNQFWSETKLKLQVTL